MAGRIYFTASEMRVLLDAIDKADITQKGHNKILHDAEAKILAVLPDVVALERIPGSNAALEATR